MKHLLSLLTIALLSIPSAVAQDLTQLRYAPKKGESYQYDVEMTVDYGKNKKSQYRNQLTYHVTKVSEEQISFDFYGTSTFSPFARRSRFSIDPQGELLSLDGQVQLPGLMGHLPLVIFERLSEPSKEGWEASQKISIERVKTNSYRYDDDPFWGPAIPGPMPVLYRLDLFGRSKGGEITMAEESTSYRLQEADKDLYKFETEYSLESAKNSEGEQTTASGKGVWVFDLAEGMPESQKIQRSVTVKEGNIAVTLPIEIAIKRISKEEIAKRAALAKERAAKREAEQKAPLTEEERAKFIADLESSDFGKVHSALARLRLKKPQEPDPKIVAAVQNVDPEIADRIRYLIGPILQSYSDEEEGERLKLNQDYLSNGLVPASNLAVEDTSKLYPGLIIQFRRHKSSSAWHGGRVSRVVGGQVEITENGPFNRKRTLDLSDISFAPPEVDQPDPPKIAEVANDQTTEPTSSEGMASAEENPFAIFGNEIADEPDFRIWTDSSGTHKIEAKLEAVDTLSVRLLRKKDGKAVTVPRDKLSKADQQFLADLAAKKSQVPNPFEP